MCIVVTDMTLTEDGSDPVVLLPSVFIIGHHGIPLDIIYGSKNVTTNELTMKITRSIEVSMWCRMMSP